MDENNNFLNTYKKKFAESNEMENSVAEGTLKDQQLLRYEEKSGFILPESKDAGGQPPAPPKPKRLIPILIAGVIVLLIIIALISIFGGRVEVIDFTNWTQNDAQLWAREKKITLQIREEYNDKFDEGRVVSQNVPKGHKVEQNSFIQLVVSKGHDMTVSLTLPDLLSMTKDEVEAWAASNFMSKVRITTEFSDKVPAGKVIRYEINDNTVVDKVTRSTPVYVIVSKGSESASAEPVTVPNFKEKSLPECYIFANENGIILTIVEQYDDYVPNGSIITQSVKANEKISRGSEVILTVSKGKQIIVPSFSGTSKEKAIAMASQLGIIATVTEKYSNTSTGNFIYQSIPAGTTYETGDILELYYSLGNKIVLSSFVGQMREAIETWAKDLNDRGAGITIKATYTKSSESKGKIIYQDISNTVIGIKSIINITVSSGKIVFVPDFIAPEGSGYDVAITRQEAILMCTELNIVPVFVAETKANRLPGEVWHQSIEAGTEITDESTIILKYNPANVQVTVPDFTGMTKAEVLSGGYLMQLDIQFVTGDSYVEGFADKVYQQTLRANTKTAAGAQMILYVSPPGP